MLAMCFGGQIKRRKSSSHASAEAEPPATSPGGDRGSSPMDTDKYTPTPMEVMRPDATSQAIDPASAALPLPPQLPPPKAGPSSTTVPSELATSHPSQMATSRLSAGGGGTSTIGEPSSLMDTLDASAQVHVQRSAPQARVADVGIERLKSAPEPRPLSLPTLPDVMQRPHTVDAATFEPPIPFQRIQPGAPAVQQVLRPASNTLDATLEFVHTIVTHFGGRFCDEFTIIPTEPIRKCMYCVQCQALSEPSGEHLVDVMFFPVEEDFARQRRICSKRHLQDFMPHLEAAVPATEWLDKETDVLIQVPSYTVTEATEPMEQVLQGMDNVTRQTTLFVIARELASQLVTLHSKRVVHCGIKRENVIKLSANKAVIWSFREYCCFVPEGKCTPRDYSPEQLRLVPPEGGLAVRNMTVSMALPSIDIWQLGILLYEVYTCLPYWPPGISPREIVSALVSPGKLPHEQDCTMLASIGHYPATSSLAPGLKAMSNLIGLMLERKESLRPNAVTIKMELLQNSHKGTIDCSSHFPLSARVVRIGT